MKKLILFIVILMVLVGCNESANPTPTQEIMYNCSGVPTNEFVVLNDSPCLEARSVSVANGVSQAKPDGSYLISEAEGIDGYNTNLSAHAEITYDGGYRFDLQQLNGYWGFGFPSQMVGDYCVLIKTVLESKYYNNFSNSELTIESNIRYGNDGVIYLGSQSVEYNSDGKDIEYVWVLDSKVTRFVDVEVVLRVAWGGGREGSNAVMKSVFVTKAPEGYCENALVMD